MWSSIMTQCYPLNKRIYTRKVVHNLTAVLLFSKVPDDVRTVKQFHFTAWPDHGVPDTFELVSFYKCVLRADTNLPGPMVVHCR